MGLVDAFEDGGGEGFGVEVADPVAGVLEFDEAVGGVDVGVGEVGGSAAEGEVVRAPDVRRRDGAGAEVGGVAGAVGAVVVEGGIEGAGFGEEAGVFVERRAGQVVAAFA